MKDFVGLEPGSQVFSFSSFVVWVWLTTASELRHLSHHLSGQSKSKNYHYLILYVHQVVEAGQRDGREDGSVYTCFTGEDLASKNANMELAPVCSESVTFWQGSGSADPYL